MNFWPPEPSKFFCDFSQHLLIRVDKEVMKSVLALPAFFLLFLSPVLAVEPTFELESLSDQDLLLFSALADSPDTENTGHSCRQT